MFRLPFSHLLCIGLCLLHSPSPAMESEVADQIRQLGAEAFADREAASARLWEIGGPALPQLRRAAQSRDPEIQLRAGNLLDLISNGIRPEWPRALRQRVRTRNNLPDDERRALLREVVNTRGREALPLLLQELAGEHPGALDLTESLLDDTENRREIRSRLRPPLNESQVRILAALAETGENPEDTLRALRAPKLPDKQRKSLIKAAVERLRDHHDRQAYETLRNEAGALTEVVPRESRFLYLRAAGEAHLGHEDLASDLCRRAFEQRPDDEAAHYRAADLLMSLRQYTLAAREWARILEIPPEDSVNDINAYMRLGDIHTRQKHYAHAANAYEKGLETYHRVRASGEKGLFMMGAEKEDLLERIADLRKKAETARQETPGISFSLSIDVKNGSKKELRTLMRTADVRMTMNIQPHGIRLLDVAPATLLYDREKQAYQLTLNGNPVGESAPGTLKPDTTRVLLRTLDKRYAFEVDGETGLAKLRKAYEVDYRLSIRPNPALDAWQTSKIEINGTPHTWEELREGLFYDFLPKTFDILITGTDEKGRERRINMSPNPEKWNARGL